MCICVCVCDNENNNKQENIKQTNVINGTILTPHIKSVFYFARMVFFTEMDLDFFLKVFIIQ